MGGGNGQKSAAARTKAQAKVRRVPSLLLFNRNNNDAAAPGNGVQGPARATQPSTNQHRSIQHIQRSRAPLCIVLTLNHCAASYIFTSLPCRQKAWMTTPATPPPLAERTSARDANFQLFNIAALNTYNIHTHHYASMSRSTIAPHRPCSRPRCTVK
jgi:hypothetical protein